MADATRCAVQGCDRPADGARGWCKTHYGRWLRTGDVMAHKPIGVSRGAAAANDPMLRSLEDRLWRLTEIGPNPLDCWRWIGAVDKQNGYGRITVRQGQTGYAHRVAYEVSIDHIGDRLEIDHLCRNRWCVNPLHLQAVPAAVNVRRAIRKSACKKGHELTPENTYEWNGHRQCRTCREDYMRRYRDKQAS